MNINEKNIRDKEGHLWRVNYTERFAEKYPANFPDDYEILPENEIITYEGTIYD